MAPPPKTLSVFKRELVAIEGLGSLRSDQKPGLSGDMF